jgi:hypothetical protein
MLFTLPVKVISIGQEAFARSQLARLTIPKNSKLSELGLAAFKQSALKTITFPDSELSLKLLPFEVFAETPIGERRSDTGLLKLPNSIEEVCFNSFDG